MSMPNFKVPKCDVQHNKFHCLLSFYYMLGDRHYLIRFSQLCKAVIGTLVDEEKTVFRSEQFT